MKTYPTNAERQAAYRRRRAVTHPPWPDLLAAAVALADTLETLRAEGWCLRDLDHAASDAASCAHHLAVVAEHVRKAHLPH